jgi:hypothetical protein
MNCPSISTTPAKNSYKKNEELSPAAFPAVFRKDAPGG